MVSINGELIIQDPTNGDATSQDSKSQSTRKEGSDDSEDGADENEVRVFEQPREEYCGVFVIH